MNETNQPEIRVMTLVFIRRGEKIALGIKARKIGEGQWNGFGGSVEEDDTDLEAAAKREVLEEVGAIVDNIEYRGFVDFHRKGKINRVHMYEAADCRFPEGQDDFVPASDEIRDIAWFEDNDLPWNEMMAADPYWIPQVLAGEVIQGEIRYSDEWELLDYKVEQLHAAKVEI